MFSVKYLKPKVYFESFTILEPYGGNCYSCSIIVVIYEKTLFRNVISTVN